MKLGLYFRQAWYNLRVNRVYSAVFIAGTAVSVALVMAFLTVLSSRVVNTVPETHRDRMLSYIREIWERWASECRLSSESVSWTVCPEWSAGQQWLRDILWKVRSH